MEPAQPWRPATVVVCAHRLCSQGGFDRLLENGVDLRDLVDEVVAMHRRIAHV